MRTIEISGRQTVEYKQTITITDEQYEELNEAMNDGDDDTLAILADRLIDKTNVIDADDIEDVSFDDVDDGKESDSPGELVEAD